MKKRIKYIFLTLFIFIFMSKVNALSVSKSNLTLDKSASDRVELYANTEKEIKSVNFTLTFSTYDIPAEFIVNSSYTDGNPNGITHSVTFDEPKTGKILLGTVYISTKKNPKDKEGTVDIYNATANTGEEKINLNSQRINITIKEETTTVEEPPVTEEPKPESKKEEAKPESKKEEKKEETKVEEKQEVKNLLDKIESKIVNIELKENVYEYTVKIKEDVTELDLKPIAKDEKTKIDISTQKISELKDNKIIIKLTLDDKEETYTINVTTKKQNEVTIDNSKFEGDDSYKGKWIIVAIIMIIGLMGSLLYTKKK